MGLFDEILLREPIDTGDEKLHILRTNWALYMFDGKVVAECYEHIERGDTLYEVVAYIELQPTCKPLSRLPGRDDCRVEKIEQGAAIGCVKLGETRASGVRTIIRRGAFTGPPPNLLAFHFNGEVGLEGWVTLNLIEWHATVKLLWDREEKIYLLLEAIFDRPLGTLMEAEARLTEIAQILGLKDNGGSGAGAGIRTRAGHRQRSLSPPPLVGAARMPLT